MGGDEHSLNNKKGGHRRHPLKILFRHEENFFMYDYDLCTLLHFFFLFIFL